MDAVDDLHFQHFMRDETLRLWDVIKWLSDHNYVSNIMQHEYDDLEDRNAELGEKIDELESEASSLEDDIFKLEEQVELLQAKVDELEDENKDLERKLEDLYT